MKRLRVVTLVDVLWAGGGAERLAVQIAMGLDGERFDRVLCASRARENAPFADELEAAGVRVMQLRRKDKYDLAAWRPLLAELRTADVVHAHKFGSNVWGTVLGRIARVPVVVAHEHTWSYEGQPLRKLLDRELIGRFADAFVAVSRDDERKMREIERVPQRKVRFVPNGIPPVAPPTGKDVRAELGLPADAPVVASVAVVRPQKALDVLLDACALLLREHPHVHVVHAGKGKEELHEQLQRLGLEGSVHLLGSRRDVPDVLAAADIAVSSSDYEGSPLAVMEYMGAGLPVVATAVGGTPDIIRDGVDGFLVPRRNPEALASALGKLVADADLRRSMGESARERQRDEFDLSVTVSRVAELYEELYARSRRRR